MLASPPAASATIMVSPMARVMASNQLATMPLSAAGTTTLVLTSKRVPPIANAASRKLRGTARSESSERLATIGKIMIPTANPAPSALNVPKDSLTCSCRNGVMTASAKNP